MDFIIVGILIIILLGFDIYLTKKRSSEDFTRGYTEALKRHKEMQDRMDEENRKTRERGEESVNN